jgi:hypothetical protein
VDAHHAGLEIEIEVGVFLDLRAGAERKGFL